MGERIRESMEGSRRKPRRDTVRREVWGVQDRSTVKEKIGIRGRPAPRNKVKEEEHLEIYGRSREEIGMKTCLHGPMDYAKTLKLQFRVGDLDLPKRRGIPVVERRRKKMHRCAL